MAFTINALNSGLENTSFTLGAAPLFFACWFRGENVTSLGRLMNATDTGTTNNYWALLNRGDIAGDPVEWQVNAGGTAVQARTTAGYSANTWTHAIGVDIASNSRAAYINGGNVGTNSTNFAPSGIDWFGLGLTKISSGTFYSNQAITLAECVIYSGSLGADARNALAAGFCPLLVEPHLILHYWPLGGAFGATYLDIVGGKHLSQVGTVTEVEHPRIIYPGGSQLISTPSSAKPWLYSQRHSQIIGGGVL